MSALFDKHISLTSFGPVSAPNKKREFLDSLKSQYQRAALEGDESAANQLVQLGLLNGLSPINIYLEVLIPSQIEIGELWHKAKINIADEHQATQLTYSQMNVLRQHIKPVKKSSLRAVVTSPESEVHIIGLRLLADLLYMDGWNVHFLGASTPASDLAKFCTNNRIDLLVLSLTIKDNLSHLKAAATTVKAALPSVKIIAGGPGLSKESIAQELGIDLISNDAVSFPRLARDLVTGSQFEGSVERFLVALGEEIKRTRKLKKMSQQDLADAAGLDRTYISGVENGKQNVSLHAVGKIASALGLYLEELLSLN